MFRLLSPSSRRLVSMQRAPFTTTIRRSLHGRTNAVRLPARPTKALLFGSALVFSAAMVFTLPTIHLDAEAVVQNEDTTVDSATSIAFPNTLRIQSKSPLPEFTLVGVGVRTVSFLSVKVYSVGFYADLSNPNLHIPKSASPEEKIEHIVKNTACVLRIVPTRSTSYSHLRDGFMRALQAQMVLLKKRGLLTQEEEFEVQSPLRKLKSMFPNTAMAKHTPLEVILLAPEPKQTRTLILRDLGALHSDWVSPQFVLAYFEGGGLSPPLKKSVFANLEHFGE
ncbi:hypothetical protein EIP91_002371 [Steccherinum ochraceum]|uniref:Chalcone isomerase domain-containing protein n=1 Tax=Steccherinum ochraceum TaxID=92696 RepID=A0A4R0RP85_9APHY|nr:hypothetical protein EIP91_002371 [Steccherinum ochraceum]